jgi:hypothetical protein
MLEVKSSSDALKKSHRSPKRCRSPETKPSDDVAASRASKRVRFETSGPNAEDVRTHEKFIDIFRCDLDKPAMWWSRSEREEITEECHDEIEAFRRDNMDQVQHFIEVFDQCQQTPSEASSNFLEKATISLPATIRGLEWGWAPSTIAHRKAHVREVLAIQEQVHALTPEMRDRVISSRSMRSSRPGRVLARLLGEGDERQCNVDDEVVPRRRARCTMMPSYR